jgi:hypothetical protein
LDSCGPKNRSSVSKGSIKNLEHLIRRCSARINFALALEWTGALESLVKIWNSASRDRGHPLDLALVNRGNQTEIIRSGFLLSSTNRDNLDSRFSFVALNEQLPKGEKKVVRLVDRISTFDGTRKWLGVGVTVIDSDANDVETVWPITEINISTDGQGAWMSGFEPETTPRMQILSNSLQPHQGRARGIW